MSNMNATSNNDKKNYYWLLFCFSFSRTSSKTVFYRDNFSTHIPHACSYSLLNKKQGTTGCRRLSCVNMRPCTSPQQTCVLHSHHILNPVYYGTQGVIAGTCLSGARNGQLRAKAASDWNAVRNWAQVIAVSAYISTQCSREQFR